MAPGAPDRDTVPWILEDNRLMHINKNTHTQELVPGALGALLISWVHTHSVKGQRARLHITRFDGTSVKVKHPAIFCFFFTFCTSLSVFSLLSHSQHRVKRRTRSVALWSCFLSLNWYDSRGLRPLQAFYREAFFSLPCRNVAIRKHEFNMLYFSLRIEKKKKTWQEPLAV